MALFLCLVMILLHMLRFRLSAAFQPAYNVFGRHLGGFIPNPGNVFSVATKAGSSRSRRRKRDQGTTATQLEWETFDFSSSPKWDKRFEDSGIHVASNEDDWREFVEQETREDEQLQARFERIHRAWDELDEDLIQNATRVLLPYVKPERWERISSVISQRTGRVRFLFENPANPSNVWACLRTLDSFGIQHIDVVVQSGVYEGKAAISQKRGMRTAMGSAQWMTIRNHLNTTAALQALKDEYHIVCTDVNPESKDIRDVDWDASGKKVCIVMGNEERGISEDARKLADEFIYLPMVGFAESFNLGAATAITCAHLSAKSQHVSCGPIRPGDLSEKEHKTLMLKGAINSVNRKTTRALFRKEGIHFPSTIPL